MIRIDSDQGRQNVWPVLDANFLTRCIVFLKNDFETIMLLGHQRIICVKSLQNRTSGLREDDFFTFPYISLCKTCDPGRGHFLCQGLHFNKHGRDPLYDATYQILRLEALWFQTRIFFSHFPYISLCKTCDPRGGAILGPKSKI